MASLISKALIVFVGFVVLGAGDSSARVTNEEVEIQSVLVLYRGYNSTQLQTKTNQDRLLHMRDWTARREQQVLGSFLNRGSQRLWIAQATRISLTPREIVELKKDPRVLNVTPVKWRQWIPASDESDSLSPHFRPQGFTYGLKMIGIPEVRSRYVGLDGREIRVGIIDTGIDPTHPDLAGRTVAFKDFTPPAKKAAYDDHGHGSHVAGTIAGGNTSGLSIGVAPRTSLLIAKAFDSKGGGDDAKILEAMQWFADPDGDPATQDQPHLVSNSWANSDSYSNGLPTDFAFCRAVDAWIQLGIVPVFSAGNEGPDSGTVQLPGACPAAITIGATDDRDSVYRYSSVGPAKWKNQTVLKPEFVAPGVDIESAGLGNSYRTRSGTSMSTPHVAGAIALLLQIRPNLKNEPGLITLRKSLAENARDLGSRGPDAVFGYGRIDALKSAQWLYAQPLSNDSFDSDQGGQALFSPER